MRKRVCALLFGTALALTLCACGTANQTGDGENAAQTDTETTQEPTTEASSAGTIGDYDVTIQDATFGTDYEGKDMIVIHYDFTNNSDENATPLWSLNTQAFQDGVSLEVAIGMDDSVYDAGISQLELKPGASIQDCQIAYVLTSTSPVEVEFGPLIGDTVLTRTFEVQ